MDRVEKVARAIYLRRFPAAPVDEHFDWFERGKANPDSCVHRSNVADAFRDARAAAIDAMPRNDAVDDAGRKMAALIAAEIRRGGNA